MQGAGCWSDQKKIQWGEGDCPKGTLAIDWDTSKHRPCGKECAPQSLSLGSVSEAIPMTTFDGARATTQTWRSLNDPVMGGLSVATFNVQSSSGTGVFYGEVKIVPSLKAPGFCTMKTSRAQFPDISGSDALQLVVRSSTPYVGWKMEFGPAPRTGWFGGGSYKADFNVTESTEWQTVTIPFKMFTDKWSDTTGEPKVKCSDDSSVCPDSEHLKALTTLEIAAEGHAGKFHLEVKSITAVKTSEGASTLMV